MSLSQSNLAAIQQAGQAIYDASQLVAESLRQQAQSIVSQVASQPFHSDSEQAFSQFKALAGLSQELANVEAQMRSIYTKASDLTSPVLDVLAAPPKLPIPRTNAAAEDAVIKIPGERSRKPRKATNKPTTLTPNDIRLLTFLRSALSSEKWTELTGASMASGSGLPLGSIGISLSKILATREISRGARGLYRLT